MVHGEREAESKEGLRSALAHVERGSRSAEFRRSFGGSSGNGVGGCGRADAWEAWKVRKSVERKQRRRMSKARVGV